MAESALVQVLVGLYLGILAALFPALIAFAMGFSFRYVTGVTIPAFGVIVLAGTLAGISGGLLGLLDPQIADNYAGVTAVLVILMASLWAHSVGDRLAESTPRKLTLRSLGTATLSAEVLDRVDSLGRVRVTVRGEVADVEGYPPLPEGVREAIRTDAWKLPADESLSDLEATLAETLREEYDLAEAAVSIDGRGRASVAAAPAAAGLSRRVPSRRWAVSVETLLPTGVAREDEVTVALPDGSVTGPVLSARTSVDADQTGGTTGAQPTDGVGGATGNEPDGGIGSVTGPAAFGRGPMTGAGDRTGSTPGGDVGPATAPSGADRPAGDAGPQASADGRNRTRTLRRAPTTTGGEGRLTLACTPAEARRVLAADAPALTVQPRQQTAEYETIGVLKRGGNRFAKVTVGEDGPLDGARLGDVDLRGRHGVDVLAIRRGGTVTAAPDPDATTEAGDQVFLVGPRTDLAAAEEVIA